MALEGRKTRRLVLIAALTYDESGFNAR